MSGGVGHTLPLSRASCMGTLASCELLIIRCRHDVVVLTDSGGAFIPIRLSCARGAESRHAVLRRSSLTRPKIGATIAPSPPHWSPDDRETLQYRRRRRDAGRCACHAAFADSAIH